MTELVFILDRSGSMSGLEMDTIGGFNSMLKKQRKEPGDAVVSTVLFDNQTEVVHDRIAIADVPNLTERDYFVRGCTALLDAVGGAIHHIGISTNMPGRKMCRRRRFLLLPLTAWKMQVIITLMIRSAV